MSRSCVAAPIRLLVAATWIAAAIALPVGRAEAQSTTLQIPASDNIFGAGQSTPPAPAGHGAGTLPTLFSFEAAVSGTAMKFTNGTGQVTCCNTEDPIPYNGPSGGTKYNTNLNGVNGISGVERSGMMFLVGVFLGDTASSQAPTANTETSEPVLGQVFFIGSNREVLVPAGATRVFLGFADGNGFQGDPGYYSDNEGSVTISLQLVPPEQPTDDKCPGYEDDPRTHIVGTDGADSALTGTAASEVICGLAGNDRIEGMGGADTLVGGAGADRIFGSDDREESLGGPGADAILARGNPDPNFGDVLSGGLGDDHLLGGDGFDYIEGGGGHDKASGGDGKDRIEGHDGKDEIDGGPGDDSLDGWGDDDRIEGGAGADRLRGEGGNDRLLGGTGPDRIYGHGGVDYIDGGAHSDGDLYGGWGEDEIRGGGGRDRLHGSGEADRLFGDAGDDYLAGSEGDDVLSGGDDNDDLFGDEGTDRLLGGEGTDLCHDPDERDLAARTSACEKFPDDDYVGRRWPQTR